MSGVRDTFEGQGPSFFVFQFQTLSGSIFNIYFLAILAIELFQVCSKLVASNVVAN